jgi:hypothetical protein
MPISERFFFPRNVVTTKRYLLTTSIAVVSVLLLGFYLRRSDHSPLAATQSGSHLSLLRDKVLPKVTPRLPASAFVFPLCISARGKKFWPGVRQPSTQAAEQADLSEGAEVIGVCVGGRARAYSVDALSGDPAAHVVNDVLAGRPVTVVHCDFMRCTRVFTSTASSVPLDVGMSSWDDDKGMILSTGGAKYALKDGENLTDSAGPPLSYQRMEYERTTWRQWRRVHPDTDVYILPPPCS